MKRDRSAAGGLRRLVSRFRPGLANGLAPKVPARVPTGMKIVIAGAARSGTTALYYALKQSLPRNWTHKFEPRGYVPKPGENSVLAKIIIHTVDRIEDFDCFDKRIYLIRDPRDVVVSGVLYRVYNAREPIDPTQLDHYLCAIAQKQRDPASISLVELQRRLYPLLRVAMPDHRNGRRAGRDFGAEHPDYFVYKYEDFIAGRYDALEGYLGFKIAFGGEVDAKHQRVARTKAAGGWRDWFTSEDVDYYRPLFDDFLFKYGYNTEWALPASPRIRPEHSTAYVKRMLEEGIQSRRKTTTGLRARIKALRRSLVKS